MREVLFIITARHIDTQIWFNILPSLPWCFKLISSIIIIQSFIYDFLCRPLNLGEYGKAMPNKFIMTASKTFVLNHLEIVLFVEFLTNMIRYDHNKTVILQWYEKRLYELSKILNFNVRFVVLWSTWFEHMMPDMQTCWYAVTFELIELKQIKIHSQIRQDIAHFQK
jgi:hypothetical protein